jgi:hypothetical protein
MAHVARCPNCGASMGAGATWCGRCYAVLEPDEPDSPVEPRIYAPPDRFIGPPLPSRYSRTAESEVTFGFRGRIAASALFVVIPILLALFVMPGFLGLIWLIVSVPVWILVLRSIWKKVPIHEDHESS